MLVVAEWLAKFKWLIVLAVIVVFGVFSFRTISGIAAYRLKVPLETAAGLYPGSDVMIAGSRAGGVEDIKASENGALVTIIIDSDHAPVRKDATVTLRPKSLLGEKYLALDPGRSSQTLSSGAVVPEQQVSASVELQQVINTLDEPTREKLQTLLLELGAGG